VVVRDHDAHLPLTSSSSRPVSFIVVGRLDVSLEATG